MLVAYLQSPDVLVLARPAGRDARTLSPPLAAAT